MIITTNMVQMALCWAVVAFTVATVVLAVQKAQIQSELKDVRHKLDYLESAVEGEAKPSSLRSIHNRDVSYGPKSNSIILSKSNMMIRGKLLSPHLID